VILTVAGFATGEVAPVKVTLEDPLGIVTVFGTVADLLLLASVTFAPVDPAGPVRVRVPVKLAPPPSVPGDSVRLASVAAVIFNAALRLDLPNVALIVAETLAETGFVLIVKEPVVEPLGITVDSGTVAVAFDELRLIETPVAPALAESVTVPMELAPPMRLAGTTVSFLSVCAPTLPMESKHTKAAASDSLKNNPTWTLFITGTKSNLPTDVDRPTKKPMS